MNHAILLQLVYDGESRLTRSSPDSIKSLAFCVDRSLAEPSFSRSYPKSIKVRQLVLARLIVVMNDRKQICLGPFECHTCTDVVLSIETNQTAIIILIH